jgi:hypothetical protein
VDFFFFFFLLYWGLNSGLTLWATPPALFGEELFWDRVSQNYMPGWLWITILLISASWVARITGMSCTWLNLINSNMQLSRLWKRATLGCHSSTQTIQSRKLSVWLLIKCVLKNPLWNLENAQIRLYDM